MKAAFSIFLIVIMGLAGLGCARAQPANPPPPAVTQALPAPGTHPLSPGASMFWDSMAPYGNWFWLDKYGWVWNPHNVGYDWRPYTDGRWTYTDAGWTWVSDQSWGWAPFHYGRWAYEPEYGWVWVPDTEWGPAWVAWNYGNLWCGWAPLPPLVAWDAGIVWDTFIPPFCWSFVGIEFLTVSHVHHHLVPLARNVTLLHETRNITHFENRDGRIINVGIDPVRVEQATGHRVPRFQIANVTTAAQIPRNALQQNRVVMFRPDLSPGRPAVIAPTGRVAPAPVVVPRPAAPMSRDVLQRQENERAILNQQQAAQAAELERLHRQEINRPPSNMTLRDLGQRHLEEHRALNQNFTRQNQLFENRAQGWLGNRGSQSAPAQHGGRR